MAMARGASLSGMVIITTTKQNGPGDRGHFLSVTPIVMRCTYATWLPIRASGNLDWLSKLTKTECARTRHTPAHPRFGGFKPGLSAHRRASSSVEMRLVGLGFFSGFESSDFSVIQIV